MNMRGKVQLDSIVAGFGVAGYALALRGIRDRLATKA
jgi:3-dehydroquinate dehydratase